MAKYKYKLSDSGQATDLAYIVPWEVLDSSWIIGTTDGSDMLPDINTLHQDPYLTQLTLAPDQVAVAAVDATLPDWASELITILGVDTTKFSDATQALIAQKASAQAALSTAQATVASTLGSKSSKVKAQ